MATPARNTRASSTSLIEPSLVGRADVPGGGTRESVWIGPARRHAPKRAGGGRRSLFGRLGHALGFGHARGMLRSRARPLTRLRAESP